MAEKNPFARFLTHFKTGSVLFREGDHGEDMFIIQSGRVAIKKQVGDSDTTLAVMEKGDFFGEMAIVNRIQRTATVTAIDAVELLVFDREGLQNMIARNAKIAMNIIDKLCRRLQAAHLKIQHLVKRDAQGLIALHLRSLYQELPAEAAVLPFQKCLEEISLSLELPMEDVRGVLGGMQGDGILVMEGDDLRLLDAEGLVHLTESVGRETAGAS